MKDNNICEKPACSCGLFLFFLLLQLTSTSTFAAQNTGQSAPASSGQIAGAQPDIRPIKGPIALESGFNWLPWLIGAIAVLFVITAALFYFRKKQSRKRAAAAHETALARLAEVWERLDTGTTGDLAARTADILRHYIEDRFLIAAPTLTTREFISELMDGSRQLPPELTGNTEVLQQVLAQCDMAKFARCQPAREEIEQILGAADQFIQSTKMKPGEAEKQK